MPARRPPPPPPARPAAARRRSRPRRLVLRAAAALSVLVLTASGVGHAVFSSAERELVRVDPFGGLPDSDRPDSGDGQNILLIGTDSREGLTARERTEHHLGGDPCYCADTIILVHLSADGDRASVVSLPRDTYTTLPEHAFALTGGHHDPHQDKLNAALSHGGPALMVRTVEELTALRVDHYLEVDFTGFMRAVDEVGGVEVCTARPLKDTYSGLDLPAGRHLLDGATALAYVRARHVDGTSDLGRMERQQRFLGAFLDRAVSSGVLLNPARLGGAARALLDSVRADPGFGAQEIVDLAAAMRDFNPSDAEFASVPLADDGKDVPGIGSTVTWDDEAAERLFAALREDQPLPGAAGAADAGTSGGKKAGDGGGTGDGGGCGEK